MMVRDKRSEVARELVAKYNITPLVAAQIVDLVLTKWAMIEGVGTLFDDMRATVDRYRVENERLWKEREDGISVQRDTEK